MPLRKLGLSAIAAATILVPATAVLAAKVVVVKSVGPSAKAYPPGKAMQDNASIKLGSGDMVTLLGPNAARTLRGPGVFTASTSGSQLALAAGRRSRFGALRTGEVAKNPGLFDLNVAEGGKVCVSDTSKIKLWRAHADAAAKVEIVGGGRRQVINFAAGQNDRAWPAQLPISTGSEYQLEIEGSGETSKLSFVRVSTIPSDIVSAAETLIDKGCQKQLDLLVESAAKTQ